MEEREGDGREYGQQGLAGWEMTVMDELTKRLAAHVRQPGAFCLEPVPSAAATRLGGLGPW
jgi:hypothetical protein